VITKQLRVDKLNKIGKWALTKREQREKLGHPGKKPSPPSKKRGFTFERKWGTTRSRSTYWKEKRAEREGQRKSKKMSSSKPGVGNGGNFHWGLGGKNARGGETKTGGIV